MHERFGSAIPPADALTLPNFNAQNEREVDGSYIKDEMELVMPGKLTKEATFEIERWLRDQPYTPDVWAGRDYSRTSDVVHKWLFSTCTNQVVGMQRNGGSSDMAVENMTDDTIKMVEEPHSSAGAKCIESDERVESHMCSMLEPTSQESYKLDEIVKPQLSSTGERASHGSSWNTIGHQPGAKIGADDPGRLYYQRMIAKGASPGRFGTNAFILTCCKVTRPVNWLFYTLGYPLVWCQNRQELAEGMLS